MKKFEFQSGPVVICLFIGVVTALLVIHPARRHPAPASTPADAVFMSYVEAGHSNILAEGRAATNAEGRAAWAAIEKRFTDINWLDVARGLRSSAATNK